jgi:hypothetical protein
MWTNMKHSFMLTEQNETNLQIKYNQDYKTITIQMN